MIVLLSDFGESEYVGIMKGVILSRFPLARIVDLSHNATCVRQAAWILQTATPYFPKRTIFCAIVDPGVGTACRALAVKTKHFWFIGPDNGLLDPAASQDGIEVIYQIDASPQSRTFHGRDIFAPAAGDIMKGKRPQKRLQTLTPLHFHLRGREGEVVHIDHFGNIITNLPHIGKKRYTVSFRNFHKAVPFSPTYESGKDLFLIEGSAKTLEISRKGKPAAHPLRIGDRIRIT